MRKISTNNGRTFVSPKEAIDDVGFDEIVTWMDDDTREQVHGELAPCTDEEFLTRYLEVADHDIIVG